MKNLSHILLCLLIFANLIGKGQTEVKEQKKVLAQFGITLINGINNLSRPNNVSWNYDPESGNISSSKYTPWPPSQIGVTFSLEVPLYKNVRFFTSPTFFNYAYKAHLISENRFVLDQLGTHSIKQYYFPLQLMYRYQLGNSSTFITPKIGLTITSHTENIKSNSRIYDGYINTDTIIDIIHHTATVETPFIKKLNLNLSSGLAVKFVKPKIGELEIGLSAIFNITNPKSVYIYNEIVYDSSDNSVISDETKQIKFSGKNSIYQFYITWYPKLFRITKKM